MSAAPVVELRVVARVEKGRKGRRVRVRALCDGRAVWCCTAWRARQLDAPPVTIQAVDAGTHWRMVTA